MEVVIAWVRFMVLVLVTRYGSSISGIRTVENRLRWFVRLLRSVAAGDAELIDCSSIVDVELQRRLARREGNRRDLVYTIARYNEQN